ncbi:MAG: hypothetical protein HBSAPP03_23950 [Phycisphaerae bacterium]|nr:MAG: hypothetical protein HBSAPP03_23950 [Phycisphaerae bacterium]
MRTCFALVALLAITSAAQAQPTIDWYTIDGGGGTSAGGAFTLSGTIGQPDAGVMSGGSFTLSGGFWVSTPPGGPTCDGDVNCDGAVNGIDVEIMELAVGGDFSDFCQPDPDFNQDGAVNGNDVEAVELVVGGAPCP